MPELLLQLLRSPALSIASTNAPGDSTTPIKVALVTGIFLVLTAAVTALLTTRTSRAPRVEPFVTSYVSELERRATAAETERDGLRREVDLLRHSNNLLREWLWQNGLDPDGYEDGGTP